MNLVVYLVAYWCIGPQLNALCRTAIMLEKRSGGNELYSHLILETLYLLLFMYARWSVILDHNIESEVDQQIVLFAVSSMIPCNYYVLVGISYMLNDFAH